MSDYRILALTRYARLGASSRVRFLQYLPALGERGAEIAVEPLISDSMLWHKYQEGSYGITELFRAYSGRVGALLRRNRFDLVWLEKEALPWWPLWLENSLLTNTPYVLDYDDAVFHNYDQSSHGWVRHIYRDRLDRLMAGSAAVVVGNGYLAKRAVAAGAIRVEMVPTVVDMLRYGLRDSSYRQDDRLRIVWIGSPSTQRYLETLSEPLQILARRHKFILRVIGGEGITFPNVETEHVPWKEETEVESIRSASIGIMPLLDTPWERGKCGYKLIQYMACGLPVVASPVGVNKEIVIHGGCGLLAESSAAWVYSLEKLLLDAGERARMGAAGRERVEEQFSLQVHAPRLSKILSDVASG